MFRLLFSNKLKGDKYDYRKNNRKKAFRDDDYVCAAF